MRLTKADTAYWVQEPVAHQAPSRITYHSSGYQRRVKTFIPSYSSETTPAFTLRPYGQLKTKTKNRHFPFTLKLAFVKRIADILG